MSPIHVTNEKPAINRIHPIRGLYAITPDCSNTQDLLCRTRLALAGGVSVLQYRNKGADESLRQTQARALRELTREFSVPLIVNDDALLAAHIDADGVHLGETDESLAAARAALGQDKIVGVSCYNLLSRAQQAVAAGADYVAFGAFFPSAVKPGAATANLEVLAQARTLGVPLVAIGGITAAHGAVLVQTGASALGVVTALFAAGDIKATAQGFFKIFSQDFAS